MLRQLLDDPDALGEVARAALARSHFDPDTLEDLHRAPRSREDCEAACYDCLMSYYNQRDHLQLDRQRLPPVLGPWRTARVTSSGGDAAREDRVEELKRACDSDLERRWLDEVVRLGLRLPDRAQERVDVCGARPDFTYPSAFVFVDGPHHDAPARQDEDARQEECLEALKMVVRFHHAADWSSIFRRYPSIFGTPRSDLSPSTLDVAHLTAWFEKPDGTPLDSAERRACESALVDALTELVRRVEVPDGAHLSWRVVSRLEGSFEVELALALVSVALSAVGAAPVVLRGLALALGTTSDLAHRLGDGMGQCAGWLDRVALRIQPVPAPAAMEETPRPGCFGIANLLDKRTVRCRDCGFLAQCEPIARGGGDQ